MIRSPTSPKSSARREEGRVERIIRCDIPAAAPTFVNRGHDGAGHGPQAAVGGARRAERLLLLVDGGPVRGGVVRPEIAGTAALVMVVRDEEVAVVTRVVRMEEDTCSS
jgi:hypothetical protein